MELRRTGLGRAKFFESAVGGTLAAGPTAGWSSTSGCGTQEAVGLRDFRLMREFSADFRQRISHQEQA